jgi:hypothetical protein
MLPAVDRERSRLFVPRLGSDLRRGIVRRWSCGESSGEEGGMRSGCLNLVFVLVTASVAATLIVIGLFLLLSFAALSFESPAGVETILKITAALIAGYFFVRVGLGIWRDLRGGRPKAGSSDVKREDRGSTEDGGR